MLTLDALKAYGANVDEGLTRCINNEDFYLRMVNLALSDGNFDKLRTAMDDRDAVAAFEAAHALKGAIGNVSLTPIFEPVRRLSDSLKGHTDEPMTEEQFKLKDEVLAQLEKARAL